MLLPDRVIAFEIRARKFGFVVLERPEQLLDWGVRTFGERAEEFESTVSDRVRTLLDFYDPITVVIRERNHHSSALAERDRAVVAAILKEAKRNPIRVHILTKLQMQKHRVMNGHTNKHEVAKILVERFEELSFKLPSRRKAYQTEAPAMLVFDALATAVTFLDNAAL